MIQPLDLSVRDAILAASLEPAPGRTDAADALVWRWLPWLLSFGGIRALDILRAKGEDFLHVTDFGETKVPTFRLQAERNYSAIRTPLHPGLVEMGLLDMARQHAQARPFLTGDDLQKAAAAALERYRRNLKSIGLLDGQEVGLSMSLRARFQNDLRHAKVDTHLTNILLCRRVEPSQIDDGSSGVVAAARELAKLKLPALPAAAEAVAG